MSRQRMDHGHRLIVALLCALLAGCGTSKVVREGGAPGAIPVSKPKEAVTVVVQRGDSLYRIAKAYGTSALDLATWNNIGPPYTIYPGQRLRVYPGPGARGRSGTRAPAPVATTPARPPRSLEGGRTVTPPAATTAPRSPPVAPVPRPVSSIAWRWPADGQLIGRFVPGDPTRQGIDVGGQSGAPVRAAGAGVVVYSGSGLVGYGELIIVKHDDAWLSAYGHNRERLVNEGQRVAAGQQIASMGRSGAARDMLHFEIRHNGKPVDPLQYLPGR